METIDFIVSIIKMILILIAVGVIALLSFKFGLVIKRKIPFIKYKVFKRKISSKHNDLIKELKESQMSLEDVIKFIYLNSKGMKKQEILEIIYLYKNYEKIILKGVKE